MMRLLVIVAACLLWAVPSLAQTNAVGTEQLQWDQPGTDLASVQGYAYLYTDGGAAPVSLSGVTCVGTASPFVCSVRLPALTTGLHSLAVMASVVVNGQTLTSAPSESLSLLMVAVPAIPQRLRLAP